MSENSRKAYEAVQELICKVDRQLHVSDDALNLSSANYQMKIRGSCLLTLHTTLFFSPPLSSSCYQETFLNPVLQKSLFFLLGSCKVFGSLLSWKSRV